MMLRLLAALLIGMLACTAQASTQRNGSVVAAFKRANPCPVDGTMRGPCPGHVVDHIQPLCAGGADATANMQWQATADAKIKDRAERAQCKKRR